MTKPLSTDLRDRVARYVLSGHSRRQAAKVFNLGVSSAIRYVAQYLAVGNVEPEKQGGDRRSKLKAHSDFIFRRVVELPDITMPELAAELEKRGVHIHPYNLSRFLLSRGWTYKKNYGRCRTEEAGCLAAAG